jgi:hypothetical protein
MNKLSFIHSQTLSQTTGRWAFGVEKLYITDNKQLMKKFS